MSNPEKELRDDFTRAFRVAVIMAGLMALGFITCLESIQRTGMADSWSFILFPTSTAVFVFEIILMSRIGLDLLALKLAPKGSTEESEPTNSEV